MPQYYRVYSEYGELGYVPASLHCQLPPQIGLFATRRYRNRRIDVKPVLDLPDLDDNNSRPRLRSRKLAGSRDNARRLFKSIITPDTTKNNREITKLKRNSLYQNHRSTGSLARTGSQDSQATQSTQSTQCNQTTPASQSTQSLDVQPNNMRASFGDGTLRPANLITRVGSGEAIRSASQNALKSNVLTTSKGCTSEKPLASANGISISISLAEPYLFLRGFEQNDEAERSTAMLRGNLHLRIQKAAKIKAVSLNFCGRALTKWPEGIPPRKTEFEEKDIIMRHTWPFFNAQFPHAEGSTGADHVELAQGTNAAMVSAESLRRDSGAGLGSKEAKRLSLAVNQSRSFGKGDSSTNGPSVAQKGYRTFQPGDYVYNFELPIDSHLPESIDVELGSVKYELEALVERAGTFRANLMGSKEVTLVRAPGEGSLEQVEPIAISRNWEDQLHYDIVISGKSFPLGAQVPIAFKLTPLAKVQCHRIKVFITENIEYFCHQKRVHRMEPTRKILLFEKRADSPMTTTYAGSNMRITSGGGVPFEHRAAAARGEDVPLQDTSNLLGSLGGNHNVGPTEFEFNVQLPRCYTMKEKDKAARIHCDTTFQNIQVHHWIKIVMRLSRPDTNDSNKRRHFEISIDSPIHILSCRATQANTSLPAYTSPETAGLETSMPECGCPGAAVVRGSPPSSTVLPGLNTVNGNSREDPLSSLAPTLARPEQAYTGSGVGSNARHSPSRPMHMLRAPSFNPPAFEDEEPPPPLVTPPPLYETIASPTSGLADYFSRLSDAYDDDSEGEGHSRPRPSRMDVPLTPGSRINRSMDEPRTWAPITGN